MNLGLMERSVPAFLGARNIQVFQHLNIFHTETSWNSLYREFQCLSRNSVHSRQSRKAPSLVLPVVAVYLGVLHYRICIRVGRPKSSQLEELSVFHHLKG